MKDSSVQYSSPAFQKCYKVPIELMRKGRLGFNPKWKQEARRKGETSSGHKKKLKGCFKCEARKALESACH